MIYILIALAIGTNAFNTQRKTISHPYWKSDHFEERSLPDSLKGKPIQHIDSVFQAKRK
jgi:hypothetical protein